MGSAAMADVNDVSSVFWNPSGLTSIENGSALVSHVNWIADIKYDAAAVAKRFGNVGVISLFFSHLNSGEIEETTEYQQQGTGNTFKYTDLMVGVGLARKLTHNFSFGGNIKLVREDYGVNDDFDGNPIVAQAIAFDIGTQYVTGFRSLRMGLAIQNFGPELQPKGRYEDIIGFDSNTQTYTRDDVQDYKAYPMPMIFRAGLAMELLESEQYVLTIAGDVLHPSDNVERVNLGAQLRVMDALAVRGGYVVNSDTHRFSFGGGLAIGPINFDYAFLDYGILTNIQTFSAVFNF